MTKFCLFWQWYKYDLVIYGFSFWTWVTTDWYLAPQECRSNWTISRIHSYAANNLKNSVLCCKQSQEFSLMLQTISRILSYAANNLKNSWFVLQTNLKNSFLLACAAKQSQEFFLSCLCCKTISRFLPFLLVLQTISLFRSFWRLMVCLSCINVPLVA